MRYLGVGLVVLAAVFWGISGGIAEILMNRGWNPFVISFYRGAVGFLCFFAWFLIRFRQKWVTSSRFYIWSLLAGIGVAGNFTFYFFSIQASSIAVAATLMYTAPVFVLIISFILRIERWTWFKCGSIAVVLFGIVLLTGAYNIETITVSPAGALTGLAAGLSYALFIFSFSNASAFGKPQTTLSVAFFTFCIILFLLMDKEEAARVLTSGDIGWFILLGGLGAGISFIIYVIGLQKTAPSTASIVAMVEPVTASLFGVLFIGSYLTFTQIIGMGIILVTITFLSVRKSA